MSTIAATLFRTADATVMLRRLLAFDAVTSGAMGLLLLVGAGLIEPFTAIPRAYLMMAGAILVPFAIGVGLVATRPVPRRGAVWAIVAINALWVIESFAVMLSGAIAPTALGMAFVTAQAVFVALIAELQVVGLKWQARSPS